MVKNAKKTVYPLHDLFFFLLLSGAFSYKGKVKVREKLIEVAQKMA